MLRKHRFWWQLTVRDTTPWCPSLTLTLPLRKIRLFVVPDTTDGLYQGRFGCMRRHPSDRLGGICYSGTLGTGQRSPKQGMKEAAGSG